MTKVNNIENWEAITGLIENKAVKHYSFDFWNTIAYSNPNFKQERGKYISIKLNDEFAPNKINAAFEKIGKEYNLHQESGKKVISPNMLLERVIIDLKPHIQMDMLEIGKDIDDIFMQYPPSIDPYFIKILESILQSGKTCSITSNTSFIAGKTIRHFLKTSGLINKFSFCLFSDEVGYGKPSSKIYELLLHKSKIIQVNINIQEIIHLGDNKVTDYKGALKFGMKSYEFYVNTKLLSPRYAVHSIASNVDLPLNSIEYSKFKFGDSAIAIKYGQELFDYFENVHLTKFLCDTEEIIIYSSPYSNIPTSSYYLTEYFFNQFSTYIKYKKNSNTNVRLGKINRMQTYTLDYGAMDAQQRYDLIKNDTYSFSDMPSSNSKLIFIDDISITGTHQRVIEKLLTEGGNSNQSLFLYYAKLISTDVSPTIENTLNYAFISSIDHLLILISDPSFKLTTRAVKYILKLQTSDLNYFLKSLIILEKSELIQKIYILSLNNNYDSLKDLTDNLSFLYSFLKNQKL